MANTGAVVLVSFLLLTPSEFVTFAQFHAALGLLSLLECFALIERSHTYTGNTTAARQDFLSATKVLGLLLLLFGFCLLFAELLTASAILIGGGIAALGSNESADLRENERVTNRSELLGLSVSVATATAVLTLTKYTSNEACFLLAASAAGPRLAITLLNKCRRPFSGVIPGLNVAKSQWRNIIPFLTLQSVLPWLSAAPAYIIPTLINAQLSSWMLLIYRASGVVASLLSRLMVVRWINISNNNSLTEGPRTWPLLAQTACACATILFAQLNLHPIVTLATFATLLVTSTILITIYSNNLNARRHYLIQIPGFALYWSAGILAAKLLQEIVYDAEHMPQETLITLISLAAYGGVLYLHQIQVFVLKKA